MLNFIVNLVLSNVTRFLFLIVVSIVLFNCKNIGKEVTFKNQISESERNKNDFIQMKIDSVYYDEKNSYFKTILR